MQRREIFSFTFTAPDSTKAGPPEGHKPILLTGGAALAPLLWQSPQGRCQGQGTSQLGPPTGSQSGGTDGSLGKGDLAREGLETWAWLSKQIHSLPSPKGNVKIKSRKST